MIRYAAALAVLALACDDPERSASASQPTRAEPATTPAPAKAKAPEAAPGQANPARLTIASKVLGEERAIQVRTPPGYGIGSERFPVLYLTDGDAHIGHTASTIEFLAQNGRMPEMIVVGIGNTDRTRDLTPSRASMRGPDGQAMQFPTSGGADKFLAFIETEVIPTIEKQYRTQPYRVFAGHSFGGLFAIHALASRPELFDAIIAVSPSLGWDDQVAVKRAEKLLAGRAELASTVYVTLADEKGDALAGFERMRSVLSRSKVKGLEWGATRMEDEDHGSVVMRSHYLGLRKVFDGWRAPRDESGTVVGGLAGAERHYGGLSKRLGFDVPVPEALVNQIGYQLLGQKKAAQAIEVFKSNVERYPASANVYDSLGEAYEADGQFDLAGRHYEKAVAIGTEARDPNLAAYKGHVDGLAARAKQASSAPAE